ncbi:hypothetical protein E2F50_20090 [Rhizobium deserti]|uniref:Uncharacterized protein n=1 Tax=Rhizobium deserti TaxID=2547961 RepID=A0A4R5UA20_9HYPH|nr:hypothetical protein [Rhizobium deserti]TDK31246.1 hypothetical protein E2F50_20090 [Rhizobium deserti]
MSGPSRHNRRPPDHMGINGYTERLARRVPATYDLSRDPSVPLLSRGIAGLVSAYERAPLLWWLHELLVIPMFIDSLPLWLARRLAFALAGRERGDDDRDLDVRELPSSGWAGSLLVALVWLINVLVASAVLAWLLLAPSAS